MSLEKKGRGMQFKEHHPYSETQWWEYYGTGTGNFINLVLKENFKQSVANWVWIVSSSANTTMTQNMKH